jgi:hypothetical protein
VTGTARLRGIHSLSDAHFPGGGRRQRRDFDVLPRQRFHGELDLVVVTRQVVSSKAVNCACFPSFRPIPSASAGKV